MYGKTEGTIRTIPSTSHARVTRAMRLLLWLIKKLLHAHSVPFLAILSIVATPLNAYFRRVVIPMRSAPKRKAGDSRPFLTMTIAPADSSVAPQIHADRDLSLIRISMCFRRTPCCFAKLP